MMIMMLMMIIIQAEARIAAPSPEKMGAHHLAVRAQH
jgi:hypothetical protein